MKAVRLEMLAELPGNVRRVQLDFRNAAAMSIGEPSGAFKDIVEVVLNTSRLYNAMGCAAAMRRAEIEAHAFALSRSAFAIKSGTRLFGSVIRPCLILATSHVDLHLNLAVFPLRTTHNGPMPPREVVVARRFGRRLRQGVT
jgi:hypothetical protein